MGIFDSIKNTFFSGTLNVRKMGLKLFYSKYFYYSIWQKTKTTAWLVFIYLLNRVSTVHTLQVWFMRVERRYLEYLIFIISRLKNHWSGECIAGRLRLLLSTLEEVFKYGTSHVKSYLAYFDLHINHACLLYTSDAADDSLRVDLGGRRIIKKKLPGLICV